MPFCCFCHEAAHKVIDSRTGSFQSITIPRETTSFMAKGLMRSIGDIEFYSVTTIVPVVRTFMLKA